MTGIDISIIILAKNEAKYIGSTLDMVFGQYIDKKFEVIIIDSGSKDSTLDISSHYPVKISEIPAQDFGHGRTRNQGAQIANGEIVVFLNADATPLDKHWLNNLTINFKNDEKIVGVYSRIYPRPDCNPLRFWEILNEDVKEKQVRYINDFNSYQHMRPRYKRMFLAFQSISCAIKKNILLEHPFEDMEFGEDLEWSKRIMEGGFKIAFEPDSMVLHSHNFYYSFIRTFKKYFDDTELNSRLLNIWSWQSCPMLAGHIVYKILRDIRYILSLDKSAFYKIGWLFYSPVIRLAELFGIIAGANSKYLPYRFHPYFSLVSRIKRN